MSVDRTQQADYTLLIPPSEGEAEVQTDFRLSGNNTTPVRFRWSVHFSSPPLQAVFPCSHTHTHTHTHLVVLWKGWFLCPCTSAHVCESVSRMTRTVLSVLVCTETSPRSDSALGECQRQCDGLGKTQPKTD